MSAAYAKRFEAVFLCSHPKGPKLSFTSAAKYMHKSTRFVKKWVNRYKETKNVDDFPNRGLKRKTDTREDKMIFRLFEKNPTLSLRKGQVFLAKKGINISTMTLKRRLDEFGVKWQSTMLKPLLSQKHVKNRLAWADENSDRDWSDVVFTDESSFWAWCPIRRAWFIHGKRMIQRSVKHPIKVHVWGCFNARGFGTLCVFTDNLNAQKMVKLYERGLLTSVKRWFNQTEDQWILQEDNDPKHRSRICTQWKAENGITVLPWPSQSPDANPIENVWSLMKYKLRGRRIIKIKTLVHHIRKIWRSLPVSYAQNLVQSMPKRCQAIIANGGDWTPY